MAGVLGREEQGTQQGGVRLTCLRIVFPPHSLLHRPPPGAEYLDFLGPLSMTGVFLV